MDPVSAIGLVGSVVGITDVILRSLKGLRELQTLYKSADTFTIVIVGWLHTVKDALDEIRAWAEGLKDQSVHASLLSKIKFAVGCCAVPLGTLCENVEAIRRRADGDKLTSRGRLAYMLGEGEMKVMSLHLGNQVQALNLLMMAARCRTTQECDRVLQDEETRTVLMRIQDDSSSYVENNVETASAITRRSVLTEHTDLLDSTFTFDGEIFDSQVYKNAFRRIVEERRLQHLESYHIDANDQDTPKPSLPIGHQRDASNQLSRQSNNRLESTTKLHDGLASSTCSTNANATAKEHQEPLPVLDLENLPLITDNRPDVSPLSDDTEEFQVDTRDANATAKERREPLPVLDLENLPLITDNRPDVSPLSDDTEEFQADAGLVQSFYQPENVASERTISPMTRETPNEGDSIERSNLTNSVPAGIGHSSDRHAKNCIRLADIEALAVSREMQSRYGTSTKRSDLGSIENNVRNQKPKSSRIWLRSWMNKQGTGKLSKATLRSAEIDQELRSWKLREDEKRKILLLGTGASGKSTVLKNFKLLYEGAFASDERDESREIVFSNLISGVHDVLKACESLDISLDDSSAEHHRETIFTHYRYDMASISSAVLKAIIALREDMGFQACLARSREYQLNSSVPYFISNAERISLPDYIPTAEDILHVYQRTTGITNTTFTQGREVDFLVMDPGGYRSERKKWIHCFEDVSTVIFTVDVSDYDQMLLEDKTANRMQESLTLFESIVNLSPFRTTKIILLLTKADLLEEKLPKSPLKNYFPDFEGSTFEEAKEYILNRYASLNQRDDPVYTHVLCLTNQNETKQTLKAIQDIVLYL